MTHTVLFAVPRAFWLALLFVWIWWIGLCGRSGVVGLAAVMALVLRLLLAAAMIMALAEPRAVRLLARA